MLWYSDRSFSTKSFTSFVNILVDGTSNESKTNPILQKKPLIVSKSPSLLAPMSTVVKWSASWADVSKDRRSDLGQVKKNHKKLKFWHFKMVMRSHVALHKSMFVGSYHRVHAFPSLIHINGSLMISDLCCHAKGPRFKTRLIKLRYCTFAKFA